MARTLARKKQYQETDVWTESLDRIRYVYDSFDKVIVSFSGGKDSTAVLNAALEVAREKGKLPLDVVFFDEEAVHPTTIEYVERVKNNPEIKLHWYCLEIKHRNACSNEEPYWYTWDRDKKDLWVRELPKDAITEHPRFKKGMMIPDFSPYLYERNEGRVAMLLGIRTEESMRRFQIIAVKKNDAWLAGGSTIGNQYRCFPIYDWSSVDVWNAVAKFGWDYNKTYDIYNQTKLHGAYLQQRVCPPYGEEPIRGLWLWSECFPDMWHKMVNRVPGAATAWRYGNTELYSRVTSKPDSMKYSEYINVLLDSFEPEIRKIVERNIGGYIHMHRNLSKQPVPEVETHPLSGVSWKNLCRVALRGDLKRRQVFFLRSEAVKTRDKMGLTLEEAIKLYAE